MLHRHFVFFAAALALHAPISQAQTFDIRGLGEDKKEKAETGEKGETPETGAFERYLHSTGFRNPLGRYSKIEIWTKQQPVVSADGLVKVAAILIDAARDESDAKALASVLAAYRDGADKALVIEEPSGPAITIGPGGGREADRPKRQNPPEPRPSAALPPPRFDPENGQEITDRGPDAGPQDDDAAKAGGAKIVVLEINRRLGARIVSNLATFRSCSGALVNYLDHLGRTEAKALDWTRMIRRSIGVAATPPDDSCLRAG